MGAGRVQSTGRCLESQTPLEGRLPGAGGRAGCQQPPPHIPDGKVLGESTGQVGAGLGQRVGESHQDTALQGSGGSSPRTRVGSLLRVQVARRDLTAGNAERKIII